MRPVFSIPAVGVAAAPFDDEEEAPVESADAELPDLDVSIDVAEALSVLLPVDMAPPVLAVFAEAAEAAEEGSVLAVSTTLSTLLIRLVSSGAAAADELCA